MGSGGFKKYAPSDIENLMFFWVNFKYFLLYKHALVRMCFWNKFGCPTAAWGSAPHADLRAVYLNMACEGSLGPTTG